MNKQKFGLCGTSCSGKTTTSYAILSRLKKYGLLADTVSNLDRTFCWDIKYIETEFAQNWHITNLISKEIERTLRDDVNVIITDRTPIDLYAYYHYQHNTPLRGALWNYIKEWAKTYNTIYYMPPLNYQYDNKRPSDNFRLKIDEVLKDITTKIPNISYLPKEKILDDILKKIKFKKPNVKLTITNEDMQIFSNIFNKTMLLKISKNQDAISDQDIFVIGDTKTNREEIYDYIRNAVGPHVNFDILVIPKHYIIDFDFYSFTPNT